VKTAGVEIKSVLYSIMDKKGGLIPVFFLRIKVFTVIFIMITAKYSYLQDYFLFYQASKKHSNLKMQ